MPFVIAVIAIAGSACGEREDAGAPAPARIEQEIRSEAITDASGRVRYIVVMRDGATKAFAKTARNDGRFGKHHKPEAKNLVVDFERRHAFTAVGITSWVNTSFTAYLTPAQVAALRNDPRVERISRDAKASFSFDARSVWTDTQNRAETISWGRKAVAPNTTASTGWSRVYVIDTGVGAHSDLNVVQRVNAADWSLTDAAHTIGCYAHSTHVAGIIGAFANGTGVQGIDPGVAIVSISALDPGIVIGGCLAEQGPETSNVHRALDWVYQDIAARGRVGIVNISINSPIGFDANTGEAAIAMRRTATPTPGYPGAFIVQSAGNNYVDACGRAYNAPAAGDGIMVVGAINDHGQPVTPLNSLNGFRNGANAGSEPGSNYGACVEAWAPGASIISTWSGGGTAPLSGTSMAAPHVAGLAAWFAEAYRLNTPADIEQLVRASMYSLQTTDRTGRTVSLPSLNGAQPTSTPYAEFRVSTEQFASPFNYTNIEDKPANGNLVVYNDEAQQFTWSFDSIGGGFWYCDIVQNGQLLAYAQRYYAPAVSLGTFTFGSTICPSASARVEYRPAPRATWLVNWADMTGGTVNYSPGSATIGFTSVNAQQCDLERAIKDTWTPGYAPIDTIRNVGLSNYSLNRFIIAQNGNYRYGLVCRDAFNVTRTAYLYLNVTLPPPAPDSGMWWNPARSGNGWSISVNSGGTLLLYWLTYTPWGSPTWYYATANLSGSNYSGTLYSAAWNGNSASLTPRGSVLLTPSSTRAATISWSLDGVAGSESIEYMLFGGSGWVPRLTGGWYPPSQPGWGLALDVQGNTMVAELLVYDWGGQPIWLYGAGDVTNAFYLTLSLVTGTNLCPSCTGPTSTSFSPAGSMQVWGVDGSASNAYLYISVSPYWQWNRSGVSITRLTF